MVFSSSALTKIGEENNKMSPIENDMASLTEAHYSVLRRLKEVISRNHELEKKISTLGGDPKQLELNF